MGDFLFLGAAAFLAIVVVTISTSLRKRRRAGATAVAAFSTDAKIKASRAFAFAPAAANATHYGQGEELQKRLLRGLSLLKTRYQKPALESLTYDGKIPDFVWACFYWGPSPAGLFDGGDYGAAIGIFRADRIIRFILNASTSRPVRIEVQFSDVLELQRSQIAGYSGSRQNVTTIFMTHEIWDSLSFDDTYQTLYAALRSALGPKVPVTT